MEETEVATSRLDEADDDGAASQQLNKDDNEDGNKDDTTKNSKLGLVVAPDSSSSPAYDLVAVHGLCNDSQSAWASSSASGTWLLDNLFEHKNIRLMSYGYDTIHPSGGIYTRKGIKHEASKLLESLLELRREVDEGTQRPLMFISHDIGGIIVKYALVLAGLDPAKYGSITYSTTAIIFFGCPHRCTSNDNMEEQVAKLLFVAGEPHGHSVMKVVQGLAKSIIEINSDFIDTKMLIQPNIFNIFSGENDLVQRVFEYSTATLCIPFENRVRSGRSHRDLVKVKAPDSDHYTRVISDVLNNGPYPLDINTKIADHLPILLSQASPICPLGISDYPTDEFKWIHEDETFKKWLARKDACILHVHGTSGLSEASEYLWYHLDWNIDAAESDQAVLYFEFKQHDTRFNNIRAMLSTFLAQIIAHYHGLDEAVNRTFEHLFAYRGWTAKDLYALLRNLRVTRLMDGITYVISGLDECDESRDWFLAQLLSVARDSESRYKIVITSRNSADIQNSLSAFPTINLDEHMDTNSATSAKTPIDLDFELAQLMQERPQYSAFETSLRDLLLECGSDRPLRRLIVDWLLLSNYESNTKMTVDTKLASLSPASPKKVMKSILDSIHPERQQRTRNLIAWVLCSFRPLTVYELGLALALDVDSKGTSLDDVVFQDVVAQIQQCLGGGIFVVDQNEVFFGHRHARDFFTATEASPAQHWYEFEENTAHGEIAYFCLVYLSSPEVHKQMVDFCDRHNNLRQSSLFESRFDLLSYAIKYWPSHYKLGASKGSSPIRMTKQAVKFIEDREATNCWAKAYHILSNSVTRASSCPSSLLSILASHGLDDLATRYLRPESSMNGHSEQFTQDCSSALTEAARNGHTETVHLLLDVFTPNHSTLRDAIAAAASCGDLHPLIELVEYASKTVEKFEWPPDLLCRVAWLGLDEVAKCLVESGAETDPLDPLHGMSPLNLAARNNYAGVARILLEGKANHSSQAKFGNTPLNTACIFGSPAVAQLLVGAKADLEIKNKWGSAPLVQACQNGQHEVAKIMLEAGAEKHYGDQENSPLIKAAEWGYLQCAQLLLQHGANTEVEGGHRTALSHAVKQGHIDICRLLLENGADPNSTSEMWSPALISAVDRGSLELVELLLDHKAAVDQVDTNSYSKPTALSRAADRGLKDITDCLIRRGADVNYTSLIDYPPLYVAAREGHAEVVELLAKAGADVNVATSGEWRPIHVAYDFAHVVRVLLDNGADINAASNSGTALYLAAKWNHPDVVKVFLEHLPKPPNFEKGLNLEIELNDSGYYDGMTALTIAADKGNSEIVRLLLEAGANVNQRTRQQSCALHYALRVSYAPQENVLRVLLEYNPELNLQDEDGDTALNYLDNTTPVAVIKLLVNAGADLETRNSLGYTPLCRAIKKKNIDVVKYLVSKKAKINMVGGNKGGPLHLACGQSNLELVKVLLENGGDINLPDPGIAGTPLQSACYAKKDAEDEVLVKLPIINHLLEQPALDIDMFGGTFGFAINVACIRCTPETIKLLLEKGAAADVEDGMGRKPIHLASFRTLEHLELFLHDKEHLNDTDILGRTPLHFAVSSGRVDLVKRILDLSEGSVDVHDLDGWTPLMWASRICGRWETDSSGQIEVIKLLKERGANIYVRGDGLDRDWSPLKVARYYGADDKVFELLSPNESDIQRLISEGLEEIWDPRFHEEKKAMMHDGWFCDACLLTLWGTYYKCLTCLDFHLCFKCYRSRDSLHSDHYFQDLGPEYEPDSESSSESSRRTRDYSGYYDGDGATHLGSEEDDDTDSHIEDEEPSFLTDGDGLVLNGENGVVSAGVNGGDGVVGNGVLNGGEDAGERSGSVADGNTDGGGSDGGTGGPDGDN